MNNMLFPPLLRKNDEENAAIGYVVGGGLKENLHVRLTVPAQEVQEGSFVIIDSGGLALLRAGDRPAAWAQRTRALPTNRARRACPAGWPGCCTGKRCIPTWR